MSRMGRFLGLTVIGLVVALITGCESDIAIPAEADHFENPYDWVGKKHNEIVEHALQEAQAEGVEPSVSWVITCVSSYMDGMPLEGTNERLRSSPDDLSVEYAVRMVTEGEHFVRSIIDSLAASGIASQDFRAHVGALLSEAYLADPERFDKLAKDIWDTDYNPTEKMILLCAASIGKHTSIFWTSKVPERVNLASQAIPPIVLIDIGGGILGGIIEATRNDSGWQDIFWGVLGGAAGASTLGALWGGR